MEHLPYTGPTICSRIGFFFNKDSLSDVQLVLKDRTFPAHKFVLSVSSPYFQERFRCKESSYQDNNRFLITDTDAITFENLLKFIYMDEFNSNDRIRNVQKLYLVAKRYRVISLMNRCRQHISQNFVEPSRACKIYEIAVNSKDSYNIDLCMFTFELKTMEVFKSDSFLQAKVNVVQAILEMDTLNVDSEMDVITAITEWVKFQVQNKKSNLRDCVTPLLKHIRFLTLSLNEFRKCAQCDILSGADIVAITLKLAQIDKDIELPAQLCSISVARKKPCIFDQDDDDGYNGLISSCHDSYNQDHKQSDIVDTSKFKSSDSFEVIGSSSLENLQNTTADSLEQRVSQILTVRDGHSVKMSNSCDNNSHEEKTLPNKENANAIFKPFEYIRKLQKSESEQPYTSSRNSPNLGFNEKNSFQLGQTDIHDSEVKMKNEECDNSLAESKRVITDESDFSNSDDDLPINSECKAVVVDLAPISQKISRRTCDVTSTIQLKVIKGTMSIIGLTFQLKETSQLTMQPVYVKLQSANVLYEKVQKHILCGQFDFLFDEPVVIGSGKFISITTTIDDLQLQCCFKCVVDQFMGKDNKKNKFDVNIYCNQRFRHELPCLIKKILYN